MGWQIDVPEEVPEYHDAHPAVAATYVGDHPIRNLVFPEGNAWHVLLALWNAYHDAEEDSQVEKFYMELMTQIDPLWEKEDGGPNKDLSWEPIDEGEEGDTDVSPKVHEMPTAFFDRLQRESEEDDG